MVHAESKPLQYLKIILLGFPWCIGRETKFLYKSQKTRYCKEVCTVSASLAFSLRDSLIMYPTTGACTMYKIDKLSIESILKIQEQIKMFLPSLISYLGKLYISKEEIESCTSKASADLPEIN